MTVEKKDLDWGNIGFNYMQTDYSYEAHWKDGEWDEGGLTSDHTLHVDVYKRQGVHACLRMCATSASAARRLPMLSQLCAYVFRSERSFFHAHFRCCLQYHRRFMLRAFEGLLRTCGPARAQFFLYRDR